MGIINSIKSIFNAKTFESKKRLDFDVLVKCVSWEKQDYYMDVFTKAIIKGSKDDYLMIPESDFIEAMQVLEKRKEENLLLSNTARRNNEGTAYEKLGKIAEAIAIYEDNIADGYPATHAFERLMIIYRRLKDYPNEIRVIERAITIFTDENKLRAENAILKEPGKAQEIADAMQTCNNVMGSNGFYCFVPYDVVKYKNRLLKAKMLLSKQNNN